MEHGTALTPTFKMQYPGYPKDWARFEQEDRKLLSDPNLAAYSPADRAVTAMATYNAIRIPPWCGALCADYDVPETPEVRERREKGFQNALRFHKMFADAGGHLTPGGNTNATKVPGINMHHEMMIYAEAGIKPMQIIQGATVVAQMIDKDKELGTVEVGKIADVIVVNRIRLRTSPICAPSTPSFSTARSSSSAITPGTPIPSQNLRLQSSGGRRGVGGSVQKINVPSGKEPRRAA